ncbi:MAG: hypothetical protein NZ580_01795 [Bacteroidia bacterium]|nr:hypothetical protein [Bacteroidia bacterium]MDW8235950.1 hypothetical protein [Bacteroidia bacterium]
MQLAWREGQLWIESSFYEGPHELLLLFARRAELHWEDLSLLTLLEASKPLLNHLPLEDQMEVLLFMAQLLQLKARGILPMPPETEPAEALASPPISPPQEKYEPFLQFWEERTSVSKYRLARPNPSLPEAEALAPISALRLLRTYAQVIERFHKLQRTYSPPALPFSPQEVEAYLRNLFMQQSRWKLRTLWIQLPQAPLYRAMVFLQILFWLQERRIVLEEATLWDAVLFWP